MIVAASSRTPYPLIIFGGNAERRTCACNQWSRMRLSCFINKRIRRQDERHQPSQFATVSVLGTATEILRGEIRNVRNDGAQIRLGQPLRCASLVAIDYDDNRLLG